MRTLSDRLMGPMSPPPRSARLRRYPARPSIAANAKNQSIGPESQHNVKNETWWLGRIEPPTQDFHPLLYD